MFYFISATISRMKNIWNELPKPLFIQAPMEDVTDTVFRQIFAKCGNPDIFFTEFTSVDGICSVGYNQVAKRLRFTENERPLIAQLWGSKPEYFFKAAQKIKDMGFDGIDLNMGCPQRSVTKKGLCSALIKNHPLAKEIIQATQEGAGNLPVSVKTRIGFSEIQTEDWIGFLLEQNLVALTVHGRTAKEMSKVPAHWDEIGKAIELRNKISPKTLLIGNGDIKTRQDAFEKIERYKLDGVMIGRGIFHNLQIFNKNEPRPLTHTEKIHLLIDHITLFEQTWGDKKDFHILRHFYKIYISELPHATDIRDEMMKIETPNETITYLNDLLAHLENDQRHQYYG